MSFKKSLTALLQKHIDTQQPLPITWRCSWCNDEHGGNLFKKATSITNNVASGDLKADIGLMTGDKLFVAIHISKNKSPISKAVEHYRAHNIIYIQVNPGDDLASITKPFFVGTCLNPRCKKCNGFQHEKSLLIIDSECWKCNYPMKVVVLDCDGYHGGPDKFSETELNIARGRGASIKSNYSNIVKTAYLSNTCPACDAMTGNHYLFSDHYTSAIYGYYNFERVPLGYFCKRCRTA